jgi:flagellar basal-body rod protein FlgC
VTLFSALDIAGTGVDAMQTWIDTSGGNIANANDAVAANKPAYAAESSVFTPVSAAIPGQPGEGVATTVTLGSTAGVLAYEPHSPLANNAGEVKLPDVSISDQLVGLMQAPDGYQATTDVMARAVSAYQSGLTIGS